MKKILIISGIGLALVVASLIFYLAFLGRSWVVPTGSMEPTLEEGQKIRFKLALTDRAFQRFTIVAVYESEEEEQIFIERILGLPGESIEILDDGILIDGEVLKVPDGLRYSSKYLDGATAPITEVDLKEDEYFLVGDNTERAFDSRFTGPRKRNLIIGPVVFEPDGGINSESLRSSP